MNSLNRYFLEPHLWKPKQLTLTGDEAHHCVRVLREKEGDSIEIFDGKGRSAIATIRSASKQEVIADIESESTQSANSCQITLCQAIPKGGNMEWIIQKSVELGVHHIQPLITENTVARAEQMEKKLQKWQRTALEACKQCGQNILPTISPILKFNEYLQKNGKPDLDIIAALDPRSQPIKQVLSNANKTARSARLWIGPEGDFSTSEYDTAMQAGMHFVSIGNIVLKVETATLFCISSLKYEFSDKSL